MRSSMLRLFAALTVLLVLLTAGSAQASFPGLNGRLVAACTQLCTMNSDGTGTVQLTTGPGNRTLPQLSPDGTRIAFTRQVSTPTPHCGLYTVNPDGSGETTIRELPRQQCVWQVDWSPDGKTFVFTEVDNTQSPGTWHLYVVNSDGSNLV